MRGEQEFNQLLAKALRSANPAWRLSVKVEESRMLKEAAANRVDILITQNDAPPVAIETSYQRGDADADAAARLGFHYRETMMEIRTAIAVELDESCRHLDRIDKRRVFDYAVHQKIPDGIRRFPAKGFLHGTYLDIARLAASAPIPKEDMETVAMDVAHLVKAAANLLESSVPAPHLKKISQTMYQRSALTGLRTTALLWLNAMLVQRMLIGGVHNIPALTTNPTECVDAWNKIREINWRAIFEPAIHILDDIRNICPGPTTGSLKHLKKAVEIIEGARLGSGMSVGAELFPLLADDRKESAAFYTQASAAEFLATMTIKKDMERWSDPNLFSRFNIVDLTCGTGTLLRFAYRQVRMYHEQSGGNAKTLEVLHQQAMERGLCGADVSPIASHMTSTSLAVMSKQPYNKTNIGWVGVGSMDRTGSIEYLKTSAVQDLLATEFGLSAGQGAKTASSSKKNNDVGVSEVWSGAPPMSVVAKDDDANVVVMNPPYSRAHIGRSPFDIADLSKKEKDACQKRWGKLIKNEPCVKTAGMAATFLCMAQKKAIAGGRIGLVLPRTAAFAETWQPTRAMVETHFDDITVVAIAGGKAIGKSAMSADTHMEEIILVATKRDKPSKRNADVRCVTLYEPLTRVGEAAEVARAVLEGPCAGVITLGSEEIGISHIFHSSGGKPWNAVGSLNDTLDMIKNGLLDGLILNVDGEQVGKIDMATFDELFDIGPTHHLIGHMKGKEEIGAFKLTPVTGKNDTIGIYKSLWGADSSVQKFLLCSPTHKGSIYDNDEAKRIWKMRTTLFYQRFMRWTSQSLLSATTKTPILGGVSWAGLRHADERVMKAFALWSNSIYGMVAYWATGQRTQPGRSIMQIRAIKLAKCPRFDKFNKTVLDRAASDFDGIANATIPLQPAYLAVNDTVRTMINMAVSDMLGVPRYDHKTLTRLWCAEPSVRKLPRKGRREDYAHGRRHARS